MTFQPIVPLSGYTGWRFLQRTMENQRAAFENDSSVQRATDYFRENIANVRTAEDLVSDRQLLSVALGAFGLDDDINNKFFIQKVLEEGTFESTSLANRLSDSRYSDLSRAFGFGDFPIPSTALSDFPDQMIERYEDKQFEIAVGEQNSDLRIALNMNSALSDVVEGASTNDAQWFSIMGNTALRTLVQSALGLPSSIATIDIDQQLEAFKDKAKSNFGTDEVSALLDPEIQEKMIRLFLVRSEAAASDSTSRFSIALTLLQS